MFKKMFNIFLLVSAAGLIAISIIIFQAVMGGARQGALQKENLVLAGENFSVEVARGLGEKSLGLSGRDGLGEREGMLFIFENVGIQNFWMKDMKFPIDIIWLRGNTIIGFSENAVPEPGKQLWQLKIYSPPEPADKVLEVRAGTVARLGVMVGESVIYGAGTKEN